VIHLWRFTIWDRRLYILYYVICLFNKSCGYFKLFVVERVAAL